jgi:polyphosphate kinase 2
VRLADFDKTPYRGLYISKDEFSDFGKKYIARFQINKKRYMKVLGFTKKDNLDDAKAYKLLEEYKQFILTPKKIESKKEIKISQECEYLKEIVGDYKSIDQDILKEGIRKIYEAEAMKPYQVELIKLQQHLEKTNQKMMVLFEGRDASGKGGAIRRITRYMNSRHYRVVALGKPTEVQKTQWYFQRYVEHFPRAGEIVLFDRSWYNRAMVEPVFGFCTPKQYEIFMEDVVNFERDLVRQDLILIKLYFSVSKKEQAKRFQSRMNDPLKQWKLSEVDLQAQDLWDEFSEKKYQMLKRTHTKEAPWYIVRSDNKFKARMEAIKIILNSVNYENRNLSLSFDYDNKYYISVQKELALMRKNKNY